jgi:hypothetical protein
MYQKIKEMADAAIKLQNKDKMDSTLREISAMCQVQLDNFESFVSDLTAKDLMPGHLAVFNAAFNENEINVTTTLPDFPFESLSAETTKNEFPVSGKVLSKKPSKKVTK